MTRGFDREDRALNEYKNLEGKYQDLISKANDALAYIDGLTVIEVKKDTLLIEVLGKRITIEFCMVFQNTDTPLGQISSMLVKNEGLPIESRELVVSQWFDYLGNVKGTSPSESSSEHIVQNNYLATFVYMTIRSVLFSDEMLPSVNIAIKRD